MNLKKWLLLTTSLFILSGCRQPDETSVSPTPTGIQYMAEDLFATADEKETVTLTGENTENQNAVNAATSMEESDLPEYLNVQENIDYVKYNAANRYIWPDDEINLRSTFCIDPDTGVVYFVNQNKDWYIYRLVDGKAELVVEFPAREIYVLNGILYFISEDYDKYEITELTAGDIYAYILADGSVKKIFSPNGLENEIYRMRVYEDGIAFYCRVISEVSPRMIIYNKKIIENNTQVDNYYYFYNFEDGVLEKDPYKRVFPNWEDYYMVMDYAEWKISLWSKINHEKEQLLLSDTSDRGFIIEDTLYTLGGGKCQMDNLLTGEQKKFDITAIFKKLVPEYGADAIAAGIITADYKVSISGFTVNKDGIWMVVQFNHLLHLNPETGEAECYRIKGSNYINELYTDGINLYGTYGSLPSLCKYDGKLVRICMEETVGQDAFSDIPEVTVEYLTE